MIKETMYYGIRRGGQCSSEFVVVGFDEKDGGIERSFSFDNLDRLVITG